ncbi:MAG: polyprenol monophosphomannose synthase [Candidatus Pacebacteria bacterium]|nr:polyprenol monophosphomannose synthase [Candidatus Paceibacterota bacterium]
MAKNLVIIPTYNEKENIGALVEKIFELVPETGVMIVDDNSPDGTAGIVENLKQKFPGLSLIKRAGKNGLGAAYVAGFRKALENGELKTITMMDGDFSHDPKYLRGMLALSENYDLVIGSRYTKGGDITKKWNIFRRFLSAAGNSYLKILFGKYRINDWTTGYNIINAELLKKIDFNNLNPKGYAFISSLKYYLFRAGAKTIEFPIFFEERGEGKSKMSLAIIIEGIISPWRILIKDFF